MLLHAHTRVCVGLPVQCVSGPQKERWITAETYLGICESDALMMCRFSGGYDNPLC